MLIPHCSKIKFFFTIPKENVTTMFSDNHKYNITIDNHKYILHDTTISQVKTNHHKYTHRDFVPNNQISNKNKYENLQPVSKCAGAPET